MTIHSLHLIRDRRFGPFFWVQALGAFNDNLFKQTILLWIAYRLSTHQALVLNLAAGIFILPFFLLSIPGGRLADRHEKAGLIRAIKLLEVLIMLFGAWAIVQQSLVPLLVLLGLMGAQSALFGPVKYAILPQHLRPDELMAGNAWVEAGTFLAILSGTMCAGFLFDLSDGPWLIAAGVVLVALAGFAVSTRIPEAPASDPSLPVSWHPFRGLGNLVRDARGQPVVWYGVLGISLFWFMGASYLTQFNLYTRHYLGGEAAVASLLLTLFSVGIGLGAALAAWISGGKIRADLVIWGGAGLTCAGLALVASTPSEVASAALTIPDMIRAPGMFPVWLSLLLVGISGGLYIVPLYTLVQHHAEPHERARVIGLNNVLNALFMVASAVVAIVLISVMELTLLQYFVALSLLNGAGVLWLCLKVSAFRRSSGSS